MNCKAARLRPRQVRNPIGRASGGQNDVTTDIVDTGRVGVAEQSNDESSAAAEGASKEGRAHFEQATRLVTKMQADISCSASHNTVCLWPGAFNLLVGHGQSGSVVQIVRQG